MKSIIQLVAELEISNEKGALCTVINAKGSTPRKEGSKMLVYGNGSTTGTVGGGEIENRVVLAAQEAIVDGKTRLVKYDLVDMEKGDPGVCGGHVEVYVEPVLPKPTIVIVGAGHLGNALAHLVKWLDYKVVLSDDREALCTPEANPDADEYYPVNMSQLPELIDINSRTYLVLTTRGMDVDVEGLPALIKTKAAYIGVIGSRRRWQMTREALIERGVSEDEISRIHSPIGLELMAETPEEIAISIMAEVIMLIKGGSGTSMKIS